MEFARPIRRLKTANPRHRNKRLTVISTASNKRRHSFPRHRCFEKFISHQLGLSPPTLPKHRHLLTRHRRASGPNLRSSGPSGRSNENVIRLCSLSIMINSLFHRSFVNFGFIACPSQTHYILQRSCAYSSIKTLLKCSL